MKILDIIWKEISLVKSQKIALLLIFLYPFLAIGLLGSSFTGLDVQKIKNINIGVVNNLPFDSNVIEEFYSNKDLSIIKFADENALISGLKRKEVTIGLSVSAASENAQLKVNLFYDNSNLLSSRFFLEIAKAVMQRLTIETVQQKLTLIWATISDLGVNIESELANVSEFKQNLASAEVSLDDLENDLDALDFSEIESTLAAQQQTVTGFNQQNSDFKRELANFKGSFQTMKSRLSTLGDNLSAYKSKLSQISTEMSSAIALLDSSIAGINSVKDTVPEPGKTTLGASVSNLQQLRADLVDWKDSISSLLTLIDQFEVEKTQLDATIAQSDVLFAQLESASNAVSSALGSSGDSIESVNSKLAVFKSSIDEVKDLITSARTSKVSIEEKLNASDELLSSFSTQLASFKEIDPAVLAKPVIFYEKTVFNADPFGILVANATAVVLVLTCLLLSSIIVIIERNQNVSLRLALSPTNKFTLFSGKVIGQLIIALIEAAIIFLVAYFAFNLQILNSWGELLLATLLIAAAFIGIGLLISALTKNQSTAILSSLLIIVPMLFLSGIILPVEFMEPFMQVISGLMPLTVANNLLVGIIIKGSLLVEMVKEVAILLGIFVVISLIILFKKSR